MSSRPRPAAPRGFVLAGLLLALSGCAGKGADARVRQNTSRDDALQRVVRARVIPNFRVVRQRNSQWCWAACLAMIYQHRGEPLPLERFVTDEYRELVNRGAGDAAMMNWVGAHMPPDRGGANRAIGEEGKPNRIRIISSIGYPGISDDLGHPLIVGVPGHAVVVYGYSETAAGRLWLLVADPARGTIQWDYDEVDDWQMTIFPGYFRDN